MREHGLLQAIGLSFYSKKLYRDVANNWGGYSFLYLLMLLAFSMIYWTVQLQQTINHGYTMMSDQFVAQVPVLSVKNGKITTPENRPYLIKAPGNETIAIIDVTGKYKTLEKAHTKLLITEDEVISSSKPNQIRIDKIPANVSLVFDPMVVNTYIKNFISYSWVIVYPLLVISAFFYRVIQALIYALFGRIFSAIVRANLSYSQVLQISLVAITPVIVLLTMADAVNCLRCLSTGICFLLGMGYLFYGVLANKQ